MIYYFTGTGNSQAAAGFFSRMLGEDVRSMADVMKTREYECQIGENETLGLLFPGMTKPEMYALVQELARRFRAKNGSINCGQLLSGAGLPVDTSPNPEARTETYYKKRPCPDLVYDAAEIVEALCMEKGRI